MARSSKTKSKCRDCTERKWDEEGKPYCPHATCVFGDNEIEWWRRMGGDTIIDPISGKLRRAVP